MKEYKALISTPLKSQVYVKDVTANSIGEAYNKIMYQVEKHEIITVLNLKQWKTLTEQIKHDV